MVSVDVGKVWRCWNYPKVLWAEMGKKKMVLDDKELEFGVNSRGLYS